MSAPSRSRERSAGLEQAKGSVWPCPVRLIAHPTTTRASSEPLDGEDLDALRAIGLRRADRSGDFFAEIDRELSRAASGPKLPRRQRKPNIGRMIAAAERGGQNVTGITTPDGVTLHFWQGRSTETSNPWLDHLKVTKQ